MDDDNHFLASIVFREVHNHVTARLLSREELLNLSRIHSNNETATANLTQDEPGSIP